jgi:uncharacterized protein
LSLPSTSADVEGARPSLRRFIWIGAGAGAAVVVIVAAAAVVLLGRSGDGVRTVGARLEIALPPAGNPAPSGGGDPALTEASPDGPLPIIASDGRQAWQVYASRFDMADKRPRIAIVIGGLGLDAEATKSAIRQLPSGVTLAFSPYGRDLVTWIDAARKAGHEVLLGLPMEPSDYPRQDPGPATLLTTLEPAQNLDRLRWVMSRGVAYVGLVGIMGERFTAAGDALAPILDALKGRGLMFVDNHGWGQSAGGDLGRERSMAWAVTDRRLDSETTGGAIDKALGELEGVAAQNGAALGLGGLYPVTVDRVVAWAGTLDGRKLALAPATAIATRQPGRKAP